MTKNLGKTTSLMNKKREEQALGYFFILPVAVVILVLVYYPMIQGFNMSLHSLNYSQGASNAFIGFKNYLQVLKNSDTLYTAANSALYLVINLILQLSLGILFAITLNRRFKGRGILLALAILPWALPGIVSGILWSRIFNPDNGLLNNILFRLGIISHYHFWFSNRFASIFFISIVFAWNNLPLTILTLLAGLQTIPKELYDASAVDGASAYYQFRRITLPLLRPSIAIALTVSTVNSLGIFDQIYAMNGVALGTRSLAQQIYTTTFQQLRFGQGTALAFWLTLITLVISITYIRNLRTAR